MTTFWKIVAIYIAIGIIVWIVTGSIYKGIFWILELFAESESSDYDSDDDFD